MRSSSQPHSSSRLAGWPRDALKTVRAVAGLPGDGTRPNTGSNIPPAPSPAGEPVPVLQALNLGVLEPLIASKGRPQRAAGQQASRPRPAASCMHQGGKELLAAAMTAALCCTLPAMQADSRGFEMSRAAECCGKYSTWQAPSVIGPALSRLRANAEICLQGDTAVTQQKEQARSSNWYSCTE